MASYDAASNIIARHYVKAAAAEAVRAAAAAELAKKAEAAKKKADTQAWASARPLLSST